MRVFGMKIALAMAAALVLAGCPYTLDGLNCSYFLGASVDSARAGLESVHCVQGKYTPVSDLCANTGPDGGVYRASTNHCGEVLDTTRYSCDQCWTGYDNEGCGFIYRNDTRTYCALNQF